MTSIQKLFLGIALVFGFSVAAHAAPPIGTGGGYYGSAWYGPNQGGSVVGPYSTYQDCTDALNAAIANAVNNFHYTVSTVNPCFYRPPFTGVFVEYSGLVVQSTTPRESQAEAAALLEEITQIRARYNADQYEADLRMVTKASGGN
jgi:hypothetical protein